VRSDPGGRPASVVTNAVLVRLKSTPCPNTEVVKAFILFISKLNILFGAKYEL
jgi:hypothetical protein